jgi:hypothetical protein
MIIGMSFTKLLFFMPIGNPRWPPSQDIDIGPGSHIEYPTGTKNSNFVEDHPRNIPAKFGSNWPSGFGEEASGMFLGWSSTKLLFFVPVGYSTWLPGPIICSDWLKFQRSSSLKLMN